MLGRHQDFGDCILTKRGFGSRLYGGGLVILLSVWAPLLFSGTVAAADVNFAAWNHGLQDEASKSWSALSIALQQGKVEYVITSTLRSDTKVYKQTTERRHVAMMGSALKETRLTEHQEVIIGRNKDYLFGIVRPANDFQPLLDHKFNIDYVELSPAPTRSVQNTLDSSRANVLAPVWFSGKSLAELLKSSQFVVKNVRPIVHDSGNWVRLDCEWVPNKRDDPKSHFQAEVVCDPGKYWCIREYKAKVWWGDVETRLEYGADIDGFPVLQRSTTLLVGPKENGPAWTEDVLEVEHTTREPIPEKDFRLSFYDLPEPARAGSSHLFFWFNIAVLLFCLMALGVRKWRRQPV
jgi:hypothetical protein